MGEASKSAFVPLALRVIRGFSTCEGQGVVVGLRGSSVRSKGAFSCSGAGALPGSATSALASLLREREAEGHRDHAVVLELGGGEPGGDLRWVGEAISWLGRHGRRGIVRTDRVLPRAVVEAARDAGAAVVLRVASLDPSVQSALLGPAADSAPRLLLGAQHLRAQGVPVAVLIAPLLPVLHRDAELEGLARSIAAADLEHVAFAVGGWSLERHRALAAVLPSSDVAGIARAFRVYEPGDVVGRVRLGAREATLLHRHAVRVAHGVSLTVGGCGCDAQCTLAPSSAAPSSATPFQSLLAPDLFGSLTG
ncbi:MAG: hypothetical protein ACE37F_36205 [Nannocystaceae bacterium]|nr:hypothetical protein [bacterium]